MDKDARRREINNKLLLPVKNTWKPLKVWSQMKKNNRGYTKQNVKINK